MSKNILVLGGGLVGKFMFNQLEKEGYEVFLGDLTVHNKMWTCQGIAVDATDLKDLKYCIEEYGIDLVIGAVPGHIGHEMLKNCIMCGVDVIDISFSPENPLELQELAEKKGVVCLVDVGLAPGMPGIILGHYNKISPVAEMDVEVGGNPLEPKAPYFYKAPFSPIDVIEEYTRPARYIGYQGEDSLRYPLENICKSYFGLKYKAIITDGLRTLIQTKPHIQMIEITTRFAEHLELMEKFGNMGLFNDDHIEDTAKALMEAWKFDENEEKDHTQYYQRLIFKDGTKAIYKMEHIGELGCSSMSQTTGLVATGLVSFFLGNKELFSPGIYAPDHIGEIDEALQFLFDYLKKNGVVYKRTK
jgi:saccharopine dehydrogenase-like NADP-dependent oxidoreductase